MYLTMTLHWCVCSESARLQAVQRDGITQLRVHVYAIWILAYKRNAVSTLIYCLFHVVVTIVSFYSHLVK